MFRRSHLLIALFTALAGLSWWVNHRETPVPPSTAKAHVPDYYTEHSTTIEMDDHGLPEHRLSATKMTHYADDGSTDLTKPHMVLYEKERPPWILRSESGRVSADRKDIWLHGQVFIDREAADESKPYHMVTSELHVTREPDYAETSQPVYTVSDNEQVRSIGMQAWLKPEVRINLLSRVRGRYEQR